MWRSGQASGARSLGVTMGCWYRTQVVRTVCYLTAEPSCRLMKTFLYYLFLPGAPNQFSFLMQKDFFFFLLLCYSSVELARSHSRLLITLLYG